MLTPSGLRTSKSSIELLKGGRQRFESLDKTKLKLPKIPKN